MEWGRFKEARALLQNTVADAGNQDNAQLLAYLGHLQAIFGDLKAAHDLTQKAVKLDPACASCHLYRFEAMARHAETLSQFRAMLQLHGLKKQLEKAEALKPTLGDVQWGWIQLDLKLPASLGGGSAEALKHAAILSRADPVDGHLARAKIFQAENNPQAALAEFTAAARERPDDPRGVFALGKALYQKADYSAAALPLTRAFTLQPASALYGAYHAANLVRMGKPDLARNVLDTARQQHPDSRLGDFMTAQALAAIGRDFPWARQLLQRYLAVPPEPGQASAADAGALLQSLASGTGH